MPAKQKAPFRDVAFPPVDLDVQTHPDGVMVVTPRAPLDVESPLVAISFERAAKQFAERTAFAERDANGAWSRKSFREFYADVYAAAQWLLDQGAGPETPVMFVSGNSLAHATLRFAALLVGAPIAPVSENYAKLGAKSGFERLNHAIGLIKPRFIFAETAVFSDAMAHCAGDADVITRAADEMPGAFSYDDIVRMQPTEAVSRASQNLDPDRPAAYMLTSGSTGKPKAVIQTNRMMTACIAQSLWAMNASGAWEGDLLEWLPWSHVSGLYVSIATVFVGGSYYIDGGRPLAGMFDETIRNIRDLQLNYYTSVPSGYAMLADAMEKDAQLREAFFLNMRLMLFGGAALPQPLFDRLQDLAVASTGRRVPIISGYGATETTSGCMSVYFHTEMSGIGLPMPGLELKMLPRGDRYELRMRGPMVTPGYLGREELAAEIFDEDGFYKSGDTAELVEPERLESGLRFSGRLSDEFKLDTGTWVAGGALRLDLLKALAPDIAEVLICGENRDRIGLLAWASPAAQGDVLTGVRSKIERFNKDNSSSSRKIRRFALLSTPPDPERGELSEKGSVNQSLAISRREVDVARLYADPPPEDVLSFD
ncbi:AMP-binding protein [Hyphococcus luteus]|nr:AMP-binding protein [Marinicaulis flavus]